jgi:hypothetical protein
MSCEIFPTGSKAEVPAHPANKRSRGSASRIPIGSNYWFRPVVGRRCEDIAAHCTKSSTARQIIFLFYERIARAAKSANAWKYDAPPTWYVWLWSAPGMR